MTIHTIAIFDTETTGLPVAKASYQSPQQPHIMQLATMLIDDVGNSLKKFNRLIKPEGYTRVDEGAFNAHGISFEKAMDEGIPRKEVFDEWRELTRDSVLLVGHNVSFDRRLLDINMWRTYHHLNQSYRSKPTFCTMHSYTKQVKLPATAKMKQYGFGPYKAPTLQELHQFLFGEPFDKAHDAMADVEACAKAFLVHPDRPSIKNILSQPQKLR